MLKKLFLQRKIKLIQEDLRKLETFRTWSWDQVAKDPVVYPAMERFLERIITRAIDINRHCMAELGSGEEAIRTYQDTFLMMSRLGVYSESFAKMIAPSAGLRNILVHEYDDVNAKLVYNSVGKALEQYTQYCQYLLKFLKAQIR